MTVQYAVTMRCQTSLFKVPLTILEARAKLYGDLRSFFARRKVLEVDVPALGRHPVTDPHIDCIEVPSSGFLQSSPEYFMKRLLVDGCGDIYSLGKAFRSGEAGSRHNPEFTLLEWYRNGWEMGQLVEEVVFLIQHILGELSVTESTYRSLFLEQLDIDPFDATADQLKSLALDKGAADWEEHSQDFWLDWLLSCVIEPELPKGILVVTDYPETQAALARVVNSGGYSVAKRFEVYVNGIELANGYWELGCAQELRQRFKRDQEIRESTGLKPVELDEKFLSAMEQGLPECSGVALGVDRLLMLQQGQSDIRAVMSFPFDCR